jgi:excisionase family DNA binding protein
LPRLLKKSEVAQILNVSARTVDRLRVLGMLPSVKLLGAVRFSPEDVEAFLAGRRSGKA